MRVALVVHRARPTGGQDRYVLELARHLAGSVDVEVVAIEAEGLPPGVPLRRVVAPARPMLAAAPMFRLAAGRMVLGESSRQTGRRADREWSRVGSGQAPGSPGVRTATRAGYDIVHAIGGCLPGANVITAQFCHAEWRKVAPEMSWYQRLVTRQAISDERRAYSDPGLRAVIAVSHRTAEEVQRHYGPLRVPIHAIPNGVDLQRFSPRPTPHSPHTPRLLLVGALDRKGLATAVRALAQMTTSCELLAIGDGDHQHYRDLASRAGVSDRVRIEPPRSDIAAAFALADAFVLPTRYEPFGMVIAEALASGVPVVTTRRAGAAELIREGVNGFTVEDPDDAAGFAAALDRIVGSTPERQESVAAAAREAVADLSWDRVAQRVLEVYRGLG